MLKKFSEQLITTVPVLTESFHLLTPASPGAQRLMEFIEHGGLSVWFMADDSLERAFDLMHQYDDQEMDLADASLVAAAERLRARKAFSVDRKEFAGYRIKRGHKLMTFELVRP